VRIFCKSPIIQPLLHGPSGSVEVHAQSSTIKAHTSLHEQCENYGSHPEKTMAVSPQVTAYAKLSMVGAQACRSVSSVKVSRELSSRNPSGLSPRSGRLPVTDSRCFFDTAIEHEAGAVMWKSAGHRVLLCAMKAACLSRTASVLFAISLCPTYELMTGNVVRGTFHTWNTT